jgi:DNA repair protein RadC
VTLKTLPPQARPREKLLQHGSQSLADTELLALLLRTGFKGTSVLQLANNLLENLGGLSGLLNANPNDLKQIKGLGTAKRAEIAAVMELARRSMQQQLKQQSVFTSAVAVKEFLRLQLNALDHEVFGVMFLNNRHQLLQWEVMFKGTLTQTSVYPREIVKRTLQLNAAALILAHNHPSGSPDPSSSDLSLTQTIQSAMQLIDVRLLDHIIVAGDNVISFAERGLL